MNKKTIIIISLSLILLIAVVWLVYFVANKNLADDRKKVQSDIISNENSNNDFSNTNALIDSNISTNTNENVTNSNTNYNNNSIISYKAIRGQSQKLDMTGATIKIPEAWRIDKESELGVQTQSYAFYNT